MKGLRQTLIDTGESVVFWAQDHSNNPRLPNLCWRWKFWFWVERKADSFQNWALRYRWRR